MNRRIFVTLVALMVLSGMEAMAQKYPERRMIRSGNRDFKAGSYVDSEVKYRQALEMVPGMYEGLFNLGDALYKEERFADAASMWQQVAADSTRTKVERAEALYNIGNSLFREQKLQEALEKYKESLRLNPFDRDAKFNLALTKKMLEQNQNDNQNNQDNQNNDQDQNGGQDDQNQDQNQDQDQDKDQNQDQDKDQDKDQNQDDKDNPDKNKDNKDDNKNNDGNDPSKQNDDQNNPDKPQPQNSQPQGMNRAEADRMLQAVQNEEDKTRDKVDKKKAAAVATAKSGKNW